MLLGCFQIPAPHPPSKGSVCIILLGVLLWHEALSCSSYQNEPNQPQNPNFSLHQRAEAQWGQCRDKGHAALTNTLSSLNPSVPQDATRPSLQSPKPQRPFCCSWKKNLYCCLLPQSLNPMRWNKCEITGNWMSTRRINSQINLYDVLLKSYPLIQQPHNSDSSAGCVFLSLVLHAVGCGQRLLVDSVLPWSVPAVLLWVPAGAAVLSWQPETRQMILDHLGKLLLSHSCSLCPLQLQFWLPGYERSRSISRSIPR